MYLHTLHNKYTNIQDMRHERPWASKRKRSRCFLAFSSLLGEGFHDKKSNWYEIVSYEFTELIWELWEEK